jgi:hypothetical protein
MRRGDWRWVAVTLAILGGGLASVRAAPAPTPAPADTTVSELIVTASKEVSELTVVAKLKCLEPERGNERAERPKVVSSYPAKGAVVRPGLLIVRVTFDQPMTCDGFLLRDPPRQSPCPQASQEMLLSYDRRTVRTVCVVQPGAEYGLSLSQDPNGKSFVGLSGLPSLPYRVDFATSEGPAVTTVCDALAQDEAMARLIRDGRGLDCAHAPAGG